MFSLVLIVLGRCLPCKGDDGVALTKMQAVGAEDGGGLTPLHRPGAAGAGRRAEGAPSPFERVKLHSCHVFGLGCLMFLGPSDHSNARESWFNQKRISRGPRSGMDMLISLAIQSEGSQGHEDWLNIDDSGIAKLWFVNPGTDLGRWAGWDVCDDPPTVLYHRTDKRNFASIMRNGLVPGGGDQHETGRPHVYFADVPSTSDHSISGVRADRPLEYSLFEGKGLFLRAHYPTSWGRV